MAAYRKTLAWIAPTVITTSTGQEKWGTGKLLYPCSGELGCEDSPCPRARTIGTICTYADGVFVHGSRSYENNWQLDGISVSDMQGSGSSSGGIPVPNPDSLQEFKVQTGLYDAAYGRYAGAK